MQYNSIINRQKEFIEVVSHEVRTPLASALFQTECLEDDIELLDFQKKRKILKEVKAIYSKIVDTVSLVNKLFSIERFESNKIHLYKERIDITKLIKSQLDSYKSAHREIFFSLKTASNLPELEIDVVQFRQVLDNLVTNAIKFTRGQKSLKISLSLVKKKNDIIFTIEDS